MTPDTTILEGLLKRDRAIVIAALVCITLLAWFYLVDMARGMSAMDLPLGEAMGEAMGMTQISQWTPGYFVMMFLMWAIMMIGMMVPSAAPMVLVYASFVRKNEKAAPYLSTGSFLGGYLLVWTAFSLVATLMQWGLDEAALLSSMMVTTSPLLGAGILIAAGVYQLTPFKSACLVHCRNPVQYFMTHWRKGRIGALRMGLHHGAFCLGCCSFLMMLLFFGGVMNLLWIAAITLFVLLEKALPHGPLAGKITAPLLILTGLFVLIAG